MITAPSRTVNDLVGVSEPVVGSTARPSVSSVSIRDDDGARRLAVADLNHDDADFRVDPPAVGENDLVLPREAGDSEAIGQHRRNQRERRTSVDENVQILLVDRGQLHALIDVTHAVSRST